ncbi:MAG: hypothetical protein K9J30_06645 [Bacteroidales bacterium]|nr:hypothetical protein [Bacteroidales bacterium]
MITDLSYLKTMSGGDSDFIREIFDIFVEQIDEYAEKMPMFLADSDFDNLSKLAHKATSTVAVMGMKNEAELMKDLERKAKLKRDIESYKLMIQTFINKSNLAVKELEDQLGNLSGNDKN